MNAMDPLYVIPKISFKCLIHNKTKKPENDNISQYTCKKN